MDFFLSHSLLNFSIPILGSPSLFSSLYTNDSKKIIFIGIFLHCIMPNEGGRKGNSLSDNHLTQKKTRFTKLTSLPDPRDPLH